jgi:archaeosine-15-forming tRNA-guanine transglycosylase
MHAAQTISQNSIVTRILLGTDSTLQTAMVSADLLSIHFSQIESIVGANDDAANLASTGRRILCDALVECREHARDEDVIGVVDCLSRAVSAHRAAKNLLLLIVDLGDTNIAELAQLGVNLASSILDDLGA